MPGMGWLVGAWLVLIAGPVVVFCLTLTGIITALIVIAVAIFTLATVIAALTGVAARCTGA